MASSLQDLLSIDGFHFKSINNNPTSATTTRTTTTKKNSTEFCLLPSVSLCRDQKSIELKRRSRSNSSNSSDEPSRSSSFSSKTTSHTPGPKSDSVSNNALQYRNHAAVNEDENNAATVCRTVVSSLSNYAGRYFHDKEFRSRVRQRCNACIAAAKRPGAQAHSAITNLELGMDTIDRIAADSDAAFEPHSRSIRNCVRLLNVTAALKPTNGFTSSVPNGHLAACAQTYIAFAYKIEGDDIASANCLIKVFTESPLLARNILLIDLWEQLFLPHLLHLKVWYNKEVKLVSGWDDEVREQRIRQLKRLCNDQMDYGTARFAMYYKEWINAGGQAPAHPSMPLPYKPTTVSPIAIDKNLYFGSIRYQAVFGQTFKRDDKNLEDCSKLDMEKEDNVEDCGYKHDDNTHIETDTGAYSKPSKHELQVPDAESLSASRRSLSFRLFSCRSEPDKGAVHCVVEPPKRESAICTRESYENATEINFAKAVTLISNSSSLSKCEKAIRVVASAWLNPHRDYLVEETLSSSSVIQGILEISFTSKDDEILELAVSILAVLVAESEVNRQIVLHADPQLETFLRLLRKNNIFLKAAVLLYLLKPKSKQMLSLDWIPLVLGVLEHGDQLQTLFTVNCKPRVAAFYILDQLLIGFDEDRNLDNAKQLIASGGLSLLVRRMENGDAREQKLSASLLATCLQADGSCRNYLAANLKKASIVKLIVEDCLGSDGSGILLLSELASLYRRTQIIKFLDGVKNDGCLNIMHILLVYLQQAPLQQRPLAAAMLLQLDLLGDISECSVYRGEATEAIITTLERCLHKKKVQEQCSRALLLLAGRFSSEGKSVAESWLLKKAGLDDCLAESLNSKKMLVDEYVKQEKEEKATQGWLRKLVMVLLKSGNRRFLVALSNCIADGNPSLSRSCLITITWMSNSLATMKSASSLQSLACSILAPRLLESLNYDKALEERILASSTLLNYVRNSDCVSKLIPFSKGTIRSLQDLAEVTWTAKELLYTCCR